MIVEDKLRDLGVPCRLVHTVQGPQVTRFELVPEDKACMRDFWRLNRAEDLAYALEAPSVRIQAPIPGRAIVGVEVARRDRQMVVLDDLPRAHKPLCVSIGVDVESRPALLLIDEAPHVLIAGQTGSGKTTLLHVVISSLVRALGPEDVRLCLIDVKRVELPAYEGLPHLLFDVADDAYSAINQLHAIALNMDTRYQLLRALGARNIAEGNEALTTRGSTPLPYFVVVVDELAELMMTSRKEVESVLVRIAQKGRAAGVHLVLATQSPRVDVVTGLLKVNVPTRVCFAVPTMTDSRVVLDQNGAERLLGRGDGLLSFMGLPPVRFQGAYCSPEDVAETVRRVAEHPTVEMIT